MSPTKRTNKFQQLRKLFAEDDTFKGIDLDADEMTNELAIEIAQSAGFSWSVARQEWWLSKFRLADIAVTNNKQNKYTLTSRRVLVRIMGPIDSLARLAGDFAEVADLIGLKVTSISDVKENETSSAWGRVHITCEVL